MAKRHYVIEAKGPEKIIKNNITIENCTYIERNNKVLDKNGNYIKNKDDISLLDKITIITLVIAVISIVLMLIVFALLKDVCSIQNSSIDSIISIIGLFSTFMTIIYIKIHKEGASVGPQIISKLNLCIFMMLVPFYLVTTFYRFGIRFSISNIISVTAIIISIVTFLRKYE